MHTQFYYCLEFVIVGVAPKETSGSYLNQKGLSSVLWQFYDIADLDHHDSVQHDPSWLS